MAVSFEVPLMHVNYSDFRGPQTSPVPASMTFKFAFKYF